MVDMLPNYVATVQAFPDKLCLAEGDFRLNYGQVDALTDNMAHQLLAAGAEPGDNVCFLGGAGARRLMMHLCTAKAGFCFCSPIIQMGDAYCLDFAKLVQPKVIVYEDGFEGLARQMRAPATIPYPDDTQDHGRPATRDMPPYAPAYISFTSGSTSKPKGLRRTRAALAFFIERSIALQDLPENDLIAMLGNFWNPSLMAGFAAGVSMTCFDTPRRGAADLPEWLIRERAQVTMTYPAIFREIMATGRHLPDLRSIILIGEPTTRADAEAHACCVPPESKLTNVYGTMEFAYITKFERRARDPINFELIPIGSEISQGQVRLITDEGQVAKAGEVGEIQLVSPHVISGYLAGEEADTGKFGLTEDGQQMMMTNDMAYRDHTGVFHTVGRRDGQTKIRGYNVRPPEIEIIIKRQPRIKDATVGPYQTPSGIARLACHYIGDAEGPDLRASLMETLPGYMVPSLWMRVDKFPRTGTGKVRRIDLPDPFAAPAEKPVEELTEDEEAVRLVFQDALGQTGLGRDDDFFDLGGDSLQAMRAVIALEQVFGRRLPFDSLIMKGATIADLARRIREPATAAPSILRKGAEGPTIIVGHSIDGQVSLYLELAQAMGVETRVAGALAKGFEPGETPLETIAEMAARSVDTLESELSSGRPITLMGHSFGGALAFEMSREIAARQGAAPPLILLDSRIEQRGRMRLAENFAHHVIRAAPVSAYRHGRVLAADLLGHDLRVANKEHGKAWREYVPEPLTIDQTLLIHLPDRYQNKHLTVWETLIKGRITCKTCEGDHMSMIQNPHAGPLAQVIQAWMAEIGLLNVV